MSPFFSKYHLGPRFNSSSVIDTFFTKRNGIKDKFLLGNLYKMIIPTTPPKNIIIIIIYMVCQGLKVMIMSISTSRSVI